MPRRGASSERNMPMLKRIASLVIVLGAAGCLLCGGCGEPKDEMIVARVGKVNITETDLTRELNSLPPHVRREFAGPEGMIRLTERMIEEEVLYQSAERAGYASDPDVAEQVDAFRRRVMIQTFYKKEIEDATVLTDEEIRAFYDEYSEEFTTPARIRFRHVMTDSKWEADDIRRRVLAGEDITLLARELSTDRVTRGGGGMTTWVNLGDGIPRIGMDSRFIENLFQWDVGEITPVLQSDEGWHVIRIEEKEDESAKPLDEVRDIIENSMKPPKVRESFREVLAQLKDDLNATLNEDAFRQKPRTEEELFTLAQETEDPLRRLTYYSELVFNYPDGEHSDEAQFMIGFIQAEELGNYEAARGALERMLETYPDSELRQSAEWMLENMGEGAPPFEEPLPGGGNR